MSPRGVGIALERDEAVAEGRAKQSGGTTYYMVPGVSITSVAVLGLAANQDAYVGWATQTPIVIDQLAAEVSAGSGTNFRIGFYRADRDWQPIGAPLADSGDLSSATGGVRTYTPSTPIIVRPGRYLSVVNADGSPTLRAVRAAPGGTAIISNLGASPYLVAGTVSRSYAAFPTPGTAWTGGGASSGGNWSLPVFYRIVRP